MNWKKVKLSDVANTGSGGTPSRTNIDRYFGGNIPWVKSGELKSNLILNTEEYINDLAIRESSAKVIPKDSILVALYGATVGNTAILGVDAATNQAVCYIVPKMNHVLNKYIFYLLKSRLNELLSMRVGGAQPNISQQVIKDISFFLPSISEQEQIVEILDKANEIKMKKIKAIEKSEKIITSLFYKMFGDPIVLLNDTNSINLIDFNIDIQNGFACGNKDVKDGISHLRMNNISDLGILNLDLVRTVPLSYKSEKYQLKNHDILFMSTNSEDKVGKSCIFYKPDSKDYLFSNHLIRLRLNDDRLTSEYLGFFLHLLWSKRHFSKIAKRWVNQATVSSTNLGFTKIYIPKKSKLIKFTNIYKELFNVNKNLRKSNEYFEKLFDTLLYKSFTGELTAKWREKNSDILSKEIEERKQKYGF